MRDSPSSAQPFLLIELERCIDRMDKVYVSQVCRSEFCLLRYKTSTLLRWTYRSCYHLTSTTIIGYKYSSGQNKVPTAEWKSRLIVVL